MKKILDKTDKTVLAKRREQLRREHRPEVDPWLGSGEKGFFPCLRTLPLILSLLASKHISGDMDPTRGRNMGEGLSATPRRSS